MKTLQILYQDDGLVAVDKPAGIFVQMAVSENNTLVYYFIDPNRSVV